MAAISSLGVGSGLDIDNLVDQLVAAEGQAGLNRLAAREARYQAKLSAFGSFRGSVDALQSALSSLTDIDRYRGRKATVGDTEILAVSAASSAVSGTYTVEVERLATAHRMVSDPQAGGVQAEIGTGTLEISIDGDAFEVIIDAGNNTLAGIRDAINAADDNSGVAATIINETGGARLILTASATGASKTIGVTEIGGDAGLSAFVAGLSTLQAPQDARIVVDGFAYEGESNTIDDAVDGITFTLLEQSEADVTTPVTVSYDTAGAAAAINTFVTAYNALINGVKTYNSFDQNTLTAGVLFGDSTLRGFLASLRREVGVPVTGVSSSFSTLAEIGITTNLDGTLSLDAARLNAALASNFNQVGGLFANVTSAGAPVEGAARRIDSLLRQYTTSQGIIDSRTQGLESSLESITESRAALTQRLLRLEERLRAQFIAMDTLVAQLRTTSDFISQQINTLNGSVFFQNGSGR